MAGLKDVYARWKAKRAGQGAPESDEAVEPLPYADDAQTEDADGTLNSENESDQNQDASAPQPAPAAADKLKGDASSVRKVSAWVLVGAVALGGGIFVLMAQMKTAEKGKAAPTGPNASVAAPPGSIENMTRAAAAPVQKDADTNWLLRAAGRPSPAEGAAGAGTQASNGSGAAGSHTPRSLDIPLEPQVPALLPDGNMGSGPGGAPALPRDGANGQANGQPSGPPAVVWTMADVRKRRFEKDPAYAAERIAQTKAGLGAPAITYRRQMPQPAAMSTSMTSAQPMQTGGAHALQPSQGSPMAPDLTSAQAAQALASASPGQYLPSLAAAPLSRYLVKAGYPIPVVLKNSINTDLPGPVYAMVTRNVYDSPTGKYLLIPQGTTVMGAYQSTIAYGQERVMIGWTRMDFPDGTYFDLKGQPSLDFAGMAGIKADVNNHYFKTMSNALMMSIVGAAASVGVNKASGGQVAANTTPTPAQQAAINMSNYFGQVTMRVIDKGVNIQPTLLVAQGERMNVGVAADLVLPGPYNP